MPSCDGAQSYLCGPPLRANLPATLWAALEEGDLHAPWLVFHTGKTHETVTRADVIDRALGWAAALRPLGPESRIGVLLPNSTDFVAAFFAAQALGAIAVPMPWPVVDGAPERLHESLQPILRSARLDALITTPSCATVEWGTRVVTAPLASSGMRPAPREGVAFLQFTSGSTADPRGAMISQRAAVSSAASMVDALGLGPKDVGVSWLPFFHDMGLVGVLLTSLVGQFPVHVMRPGEFLMRPRRWLELVSSVRATLTVGPNFAWELLARRVSAEGLDLSSLRCALNGSEPIHRSTLEHVAQRFGPAGLARSALLCVYGLAEATLGVAFSRPDSTLADLEVDGRAVPSVGPVLAGVELSVVDRNGEVVAVGEEGELCVRGPMVMNGYFDHPESGLQGGWLRTGDLGVVRNRAVYVTGREKELVIQAGRKFHPYDIERVVSAMVDTTPNGVAAVSRPDPELGSEALVVVVELRRQSGAIDPLKIKGELLRALGVRADSVVYVPAGSLPRTTSGKIKRRALSELSPSPSGRGLGVRELESTQVSHE